MSKTLSLLKQFHVDLSHIFVYVVPEEHERYMDAGVSTMAQLRPGRPGLLAQRRAIREDWPDDKPILCMDDDIEALYELHQGTLIPFSSDFTIWVTNHFIRLRQEGLCLWGIYPVRNAYFMDKGGVSTHPCFIVGAFYGILNSRDPSYEATIEEKEDVERSLRAARQDGGVLRDNNVTLLTRYYTEPGGMQRPGEDRRVAAAASAAYLAQTYPELCYLYTGKRSGYHEVRWRRRLQRSQFISHADTSKLGLNVTSLAALGSSIG